MAKLRLQKFLAQAGVASRRQAEQLIAEGLVSVNGQIQREMGLQIDPEQDQITLRGQLLQAEPALQYLLLNKPENVMVTRNDPQQRQTVYHLLPESYHHLHPVGRLDRNSCGLLLLTNDGDLTQRLLHPRYKMPKTYRVRVRGLIQPQALQQLAEGVELSDGRTLPAEIHLLGNDGRASLLQFTLQEGRNRQIRRMCKAVGYEVLYLQRTTLGPLELAQLKPGQFRLLQPPEISGLRQQAGLGP